VKQKHIFVFFLFPELKDELTNSEISNY